MQQLHRLADQTRGWRVTATFDAGCPVTQQCRQGWQRQAYLGRDPLAEHGLVCAPRGAGDRAGAEGCSHLAAQQLHQRHQLLLGPHKLCWHRCQEVLVCAIPGSDGELLPAVHTSDSAASATSIAPLKVPSTTLHSDAAVHPTQHALRSTARASTHTTHLKLGSTRYWVVCTSLLVISRNS